MSDGWSYSPFWETFCSDPLWDWNVTWNTDNPGMTHCFQWTILIWIPCAFLWMTVAIQLLLERGKLPGLCQIRRWTLLSALKTVLVVLLVVHAIVQLGNHAYIWRTEGLSNLPDAEITATFVRLATFILATVVIVRQKRRAKPTSAVLFLFWLLILAAALLTFVSLLRHKGVENHVTKFRHYMEMIYFPIVLLQFILSCIADNYAEITADNPNLCPEELASFPSKLTFWWITGLIYKGWRRALTNEDLWDLQVEDKTEVHAPRFDQHWNSELKRKRESRDKYSPSLTKALWKTFWVPLTISALLKFTGDLFIFLAPYQLKLLIRFVNDKDEEAWKGYIYVIGMLLGSSAQVLALAHYFLYNQRTGMHIRSAVVTAVYRKALRMTSAATHTSTIGAVVNLMSVDSQRFMDFMNQIQLLWSSPMQIIIAMVFLWREMGIATLSGAAALALLIPFNAWVAGRSKGFQVAQMKSKDGRMKLMNEILNGIKILKLYAWEPSFERQVLDIRDQELSTLKKSAYLTALSSFIMQSSPFVVALVTFATFVSINDTNILNAEKAFVSLTLFNILRRPLILLPDAINSLVQTRVSVSRVKCFLLNEELDLASETRLPADEQNAVEIANGSFSWNDGPLALPMLRNINVSVPSGSLVAIVGPVGAGKSSLVAAMLGLMHRLSGTVAVKENVAYVTQQAWIQNLTLRKNILFGKPFDEARYERVLQACALKEDLAMLPAGDQTEIGEKGINLSGGQKQRVSLARAVYSEAEVLFLDDPLSAVDAHVGKHIFEQVIGPNGLLANRTRILVTHGISFLPQTGSIVVMNDGQITEVGSYQQLVNNSGHFAEFLQTYQTQTEGHHEMESQQADLVKGNNLGKSDTVKSTDQSLERTNSTNKPRNIEKTPAKDGVKKGQLVEAEKSQTGSVRWGIYVMFLRNMTWILVFGVFTSYLLSNAANVATNIWLGEWADDSRYPDRANSTWWRHYRLGVYGGLGSAQGIFILISALCLAGGQIHASRTQHEGMLLRIMRAPMAFFDTTPLGRIVNRFSKDVDTLDVQVPQNFRLWMNCFFQVAATIVIVCMATPIFAAVVVPLGLVYYLMQRFYIPTSRQLKRLEATSRSPIYSHFQESVTGSSIIVAQRQMDRFMLDNERLLDYNNGIYFTNGHAQRWLSMRIEFVGIFAVMFAGLFAVMGRDKNWGMEDKDVGLSISYALNVTQILNMMVRVASELETNIVSVERIQEYTEIVQEAAWIIDRKRPEENWPREGGLTFSNYKLRYRQGLPLVLHGVDAVIQPGEKVGIVGRTGAGKSSLTLALFRLIEADSGSLSIDDVDVSTIGLHDLRSRLTIIPQEPVLFSGSLRMNLDPFDVYSDKEIWNALSNAHLQEYVSSLEHGLLHRIAEGGENLSLGQRQLICLARALLRKSKILVLDEATAAIDLETDALIQTTIRQQFVGCTVLTIAHRLSTIMDNSRVMVMDHGIVKEFASPSALLEDHSSIFYTLARSADLVE